MAKKSSVPGPDPLPKIDDLVEYIWPNNGSQPALSDKVLRAKVTAVYEGFDGRLVDLDVDSGKGPLPVKSAPWRDEADGAGNTWHWPA